MARISRREFLRQAGQAGLAVGIGAQLGGLWGCSGSGRSVVTSTGSYDAIIVGGGTAGAIVATKLQAAGGGRKRILIIEAGGPTSAAIGGTDFPPWLPPGRTDLTIFDVPGRVLADGVHAAGRAVPAHRDAVHLSGHRTWAAIRMFNGMLFQTNPPAVFDSSWPAGWHWADMATVLPAACASKVPVTNTPSTDGIPQNTGPAMIVHPLYAGAGWVEGDTSQPFIAPGVYSRPYVAATKRPSRGADQRIFRGSRSGRRAGAGPRDPAIRQGRSDRLRHTGNARAVHYTKRGASTSRSRARPALRNCARGGLLVMAAGALVTPRLLLLERRRSARPRGGNLSRSIAAPFAIDNPLVGVGVFDHVMTMVTYSYDGPVPYQAYNYGDYAGQCGRPAALPRRAAAGRTRSISRYRF